MTITNFDTLIQDFVKATNLKHTPGRLYDKVHATTGGVYMVERSTGDIYGIKSWNQHNPRRLYGNLNTIGEWDWTASTPTPLPGTPSETAHNLREQAFASKYQKRGRPIGAKNKAKTLSTSST